MTRRARRVQRLISALCVLLSSAALRAQAPATGSTPAPLTVERLADGVYAFIGGDPEGYANNANSLVVIGDREVLVVDAQFTRAATLQALATIRRLTEKPVRYVVNTHWHDDHVAGNQVYRDTFPNVEFISHVNTREDLATIGAENRRNTVAAATPFAARVQRLLDRGIGFDSLPADAHERAVLANTIAVIREYAAEASTFREMLADITFSRRLVLHLAPHPIEIRWFGRGNTRGDAVVYLPDQHIVASGDLLVAPVPFAFNAYVGEWIAALDSLDALHAAAIVPGHGPVEHDDAYLRTVSAMLTTVRDSTRAVAARGGSLADAQRAITLSAERRAIAAGDRWTDYLFANFFLAPAVTSAFAEATATRKQP